ncbi:LacI family DNA-binding transcriptional regulator [Niabella drilacis]|uniref:Transcriptional regulator, LacI family n=1 Tax=Niabella drilacis (strain DSM 25811 / CCM 8410 / CCUG 62505 / LMG 26954 / E90) TaxID=1285928 RepID=A0A1G6JL63_NIADE|nr:substrate-binding domain-containing protein [Niabella drilacis]SDC19408.1 transcriptional regulator, LacI family [Niabella drilacis]
MQKRVSLKDIAEKVGVSTALVSYVLNGKEKEARVGEAAAKKIKKVAAEMNYQPNLIARGLKFGKTHTIGLIVADISNPFFAMLARIIELEAQKRGYTVLFGSSDEQLEKSQNLINTFLNRQVDGLIITPVAGSQSQIEVLQDKGVPFVLMDRGFSETETNMVVTDNHDAMYNAVQLLIRNGYKKPGIIAYDTTLTHMTDRIAGYKDALKDSGIRFNAKWLVKVPYGNYKEDVTAALDRFLDVKGSVVDSLVFATNSISVQSLKVIHARGIKVPQDLGVISFDESDVFDFFYAPITYIKQNLQAISENAVQLLMQSIDARSKKYTKVTVPSIIIKGKSSNRSKTSGGG